MKIKYRSIEFFGVPGKEKLFLIKKIKTNLKIKGYKVFNAREIIVLFIGRYITLKMVKDLLSFI